MATLIDLPGRQGRIADAYFESAVVMGRRALTLISRSAVARALASGGHITQFFNDEELAKLIQVLAATLGTADLLGRARVRQQWTATLAAHGELPRLTEEQAARLNTTIHGWLVEDEKSPAAPEPMLPLDALRYFRELVPSLNVDPLRWGTDLRRRVFAIAASTQVQLTQRVQDTISTALETGQVSRTALDIKDILDAAGVSVANPQYSEMVFRTNAIDAYNQASTEELQDPDVIETFPVWEYSNPDDERSRPEHAARNGQYYPSAVAFVAVRGTSVGDAANCRCTNIPVSKWKWAKLKAGGARIADGYPDVLSMDEMQAAFPLRPAAVA